VIVDVGGERVEIGVPLETAPGLYELTLDAQRCSPPTRAWVRRSAEGSPCTRRGSCAWSETGRDDNRPASRLVQFASGAQTPGPSARPVNDRHS